MCLVQPKRFLEQRKIRNHWMPGQFVRCHQIKQLGLFARPDANTPGYFDRFPRYEPRHACFRRVGYALLCNLAVFAPVSYTHLDVYKRQVHGCLLFVCVQFLL